VGEIPFELCSVQMQDEAEALIHPSLTVGWDWQLRVPITRKGGMKMLIDGFRSRIIGS